jgi:hypothetical protein
LPRAVRSAYPENPVISQFGDLLDLRMEALQAKR